MKFIFLSNEFYEDFADCTEIEKKADRPYIQVAIEVDGVLYAIPLRSKIKHPFVFYTDKEKLCGLDFTKTVLITDNKYIDRTRRPHIRENEFQAMRNKEYQIKQGLFRYIKKYKKAYERRDVPRNARLCKYSTLQYFEEYL